MGEFPLNNPYYDAAIAENAVLRERLRRLLEDNARQERRIAELGHMATVDAVTGVLNSNTIRGLLRDKIERYNGTPFALFVGDVDRFKDVNDTLGHDRGDELLNLIGSYLDDHLRQSDVSGVVGRPGGDEFWIIADLIPRADRFEGDRMTPEERCKKLHMKLDSGLKAVIAEFRKSQNPGELVLPEGVGTLSIGYAIYVPGESVKDFTSRVDKNMYTEKRSRVDEK